MNKQQMNYMRDKMEISLRTALDTMDRNNRKIVDDLLVDKLAAAGFNVHPDRRYTSLIASVWTDDLKAMAIELKDKYEAAAKTLRKKKDAAVDSIMLGSDKDALALLQEFNAELAELTK